ncbi:hypothetical protein ACJ73_10337, partial [Blastomyces percursus]
MAAAGCAHAIAAAAAAAAAVVAELAGGDVDAVDAVDVGGTAAAADTGVHSAGAVGEVVGGAVGAVVDADADVDVDVDVGGVPLGVASLDEVVVVVVEEVADVRILRDGRAGLGLHALSARACIVAAGVEGHAYHAVFDTHLTP